MQIFRKTFAVLLVLSLLFAGAVQAKELVSGSFEGVGKGRGGEIKIELVLENSKIKEIKLLSHNETPGFDKALEELPKAMIEKNSLAVDAFSGSTMSSDGIKEAVKDALKKAGLAPEDLIPNEETAKEMMKEFVEEDFDVVVIGAGGAGLTAAISAKEAGAKVLVLEKMPFVGGNTLISGAEYAAPANWIQKEEGIEDSPELLAKDIEKAGGQPELIKVLAENALKEAMWLRDSVGVEWEKELMFFGGHSVKRSLIPKGASGKEIVTKLDAKAKALEIPVYLGTKALSLTQDENGRVNGVTAESMNKHYTIRAKAVVMATGGFGSNIEMRVKYNPEIDGSILSTNSVGSTGDGLVMGEAIGAELTGMEHIQLYPICDAETGSLLYMDDTRLYGMTILVNQEGKRFVEELDTRYAISMGIKAQKGSYTYELWDEDATQKSKILENHYPEYESLVERKLMHKAESLEEAAKFFGIPEEALKETVATWNSYVDAGKDPDFNKRGTLVKIEKAPFYIMKAVPAVHHTMGGLSIDTESHVLNKDGKRIEGLFAAGEVTGGIHGKNRLGSAALADIIVFGRIAGANAAALALQK